MTDIFNRFGVGVQGDEIVILMPPHGSITKEAALVMAAWLVALADTDDKFADILEEVENT